MKTDVSRKGKIGFQGAMGANSQIAINELFPAMEAIACNTFEDVFRALDGNKIDLAMIPIENTIAGRVADIHHLLPHSETFITGEYFLPIRFDLLALPGTKISQIDTVFSHVHALGQCRKIIAKHRWRAVVHSDTAGSAQYVAEQGKANFAALAPDLAGRIYGLEALAKNVEDADHNTTRFFILSKEKLYADPGNGPVMTSFLFQVRNIPAALYKAMGGFATNGVNMTKLESYQLGGSFAATQFFADIEGHPDDVAVKHAFEELQFFCKQFRILGVYPKAQDR